MIKPAVLDAMVAAGCTAEQIAAAVKADQARASGASRQARYRANKAARESAYRDESDISDVTQRNVTGGVSPKKETSPTPPKEKTTPSTVSEPDGSSTERARPQFSDFWALFPNKVGKRDAEKAWPSAIKRASPEQIMDGLRRYVAKTDDRPWCNPATFLNQDRHADQPAMQLQQRGPPRKPNAFDAYDEIAREKGWLPDEPKCVSSPDSDAQRLPAERSEPQGTVVDLRSGAYRRL